MLTREERFYREQQFSSAYQDRLDDLKFKYPKHNYEILHQLAQMLYPKLFAATTGEFDDDFDLKSYIEEEPQFKNAAEELAFRAKVYSLENNIVYEAAATRILKMTVIWPNATRWKIFEKEIFQMKIDETFITKIKLERNLQSVLNNLIVLARTVAQIQEHLGIDNETKPEKEAAGV